MTILNFVLNLVDTAAHLLWPQSCPACGAVGVPFCDECLEQTIQTMPAFCVQCGGLYGVPCCDGSLPVYALGAHEGLAREFMIRFKYRGARALGEAMGHLIARNQEPPFADLIVPVPLHIGSKHAYNQSELIARGVAAAWDIPVDVSCVRWRRGVGRQTDKSGLARRSINENALLVDERIAGKKIILIDDVYTTGATLRAMRDALAAQGAEVVCAFVWSRRLGTAENELAWKGAKTAF